MAKVRISGFGSAFELENELVGIGTDNPTNNLQALGNIRSSNAKVVGVSTFTTFDGFIDTKAVISGAGGAKSGSISGEIIIEGSVDVSTGTTFTSGPKNLTVTDSFTLPGVSDDKPSVGTTRFNDHLGALEFYTGVEWKAVGFRVDSGSGGRAVYGGGNNAPSPFAADVFTSINIHTLGNSVHFGDSQHSNWALAGGGCDGRRGIFAGGLPNASHYNTIEYVTVASSGNAINFGDLSNSQGRDSGGAATTSTRMCITGALYRTPGNTVSNIIDYVETQTTGNAVDFGDQVTNMCSGNGFSSPTRGFFFGTGFSTPDIPIIHYITISSKGNSTDFGDSTAIRAYPGGGSNGTRGIISGGSNPLGPPVIKTIDFVTMSSSGNAILFGDLTLARHSPAGASSKTRTVFAGGYTSPSDSLTDVNNMDYITIASAGNAQDFGDLYYKTSFLCSASDSHGGLGGF